MYKTLADCQALALHLNDPNWVIVDCRFMLSKPEAGYQAYLANHIPGARYAHLNDDLSSPPTTRSGRHPLPDPERLAERLGLWGISRDTQVVAYDDSFGAMAARLWWLLRWLGHSRVALLDGGLPAWQRAEYPMTQDLPTITPTRFVPQASNDVWITSADVEKARLQTDSLIMDARAEERFRGEIEPLDAIAGHIPGAVNVPYEDNLHISGTFLSAAELRELYLGIMGEVRPDKIIQMCGSGVTACHNILAMEHAGLTGAKLYAGSWSEWITDDRRPVARET